MWETNMRKRLLRQLLAVTVFTIITSFALGQNTGNADRRIEVHNTSEKKINKILASTDGETYTEFEIPRGIKPGQTVDVNWNRGQGRQCEWYLKVQYADRSESAPTHVDVCERDITLEFN
jgi:hypothetical protein